MSTLYKKLEYDDNDYPVRTLAVAKLVDEKVVECAVSYDNKAECFSDCRDGNVTKYYAEIFEGEQDIGHDSYIDIISHDEYVNAKDSLLRQKRERLAHGDFGEYCTDYLDDKASVLEGKKTISGRIYKGKESCIEIAKELMRKHRKEFVHEQRKAARLSQRDDDLKLREYFCNDFSTLRLDYPKGDLETEQEYEDRLDALKQQRIASQIKEMKGFLKRHAEDRAVKENEASGPVVADKIAEYKISGAEKRTITPEVGAKIRKKIAEQKTHGSK